MSSVRGRQLLKPSRDGLVDLLSSKWNEAVFGRHSKVNGMLASGDRFQFAPILPRRSHAYDASPFSFDSAWCSQKVISMCRYKSMAADNSICARVLSLSCRHNVPSPK